MPHNNTALPTAQQLDILFHQLIARRPNLSTRENIRRALQDLGIDDSSEFVERVEILRSEHTYRRRSRLFRRAYAHLGHTPGVVWVPSHPKLALPQGTPTERLANTRSGTLIAVARGHFRWGAVGGTSCHVRLTRSAESVGYEVHVAQKRNTWHVQLKGCEVAEDHHRITVPHNWLSKIYQRQMESFGGRMTLNATLVERHTDGIELYAAVWASQGYGYTVETSSGFLALSRGRHQHAESADKALDGLRLKLKSVEFAHGSVALGEEEAEFV